jgi:formate dehydrogenase iron-sulfur subunit
MPISFFLSSIAAGTSLVILVEMWIAKGWKRKLPIVQLSAMGQISCWALLVYLVFRLGDMAVRGGFSGAFSGKLGFLFVTEILVGGIVPLALLAPTSLRLQPKVLFAGTLLVTLGVIFNRANVVLLAIHLKGPMPQIAPASYTPTIFEWGVSVGLIAATIFLFGLGARLLPLLPKQEAARTPVP